MKRIGAERQHQRAVKGYYAAMKIVSLRTSLVLLVYWEFHFMIRLKNREREGIIIVKGKIPTAICQMKNSQLPIFEQDKVRT